eukprot:CAMPEP_0195517946 /NCGR_PEP_ID=MMETSP0794_2-20130614/11835_1 /TAXON_ID=515487 /ORGANISM="Stephanopyxis turris, Strain CCMP 815" /LENGTH=480 /DNA_ID=CAMNT_0040646831 /DNA_START=1 /DNA_END=1443 /DNA_ORIENTATION=+
MRFFFQVLIPLALCTSIESKNVHDEKELAFQPMQLTDGSIFNAYVRPDVSTFYENTNNIRKQRKVKEVKPRYLSQVGKYCNLTPYDDEIVVDNSMKATVKAFECARLTINPGERVCFSRGKCKKTFSVMPGKSNYEYDCNESYAEIKDLDDEEIGCRGLPNMSRIMGPNILKTYFTLKKSVDFAGRYRRMTGIDYLSRYPRSKPIHNMWRADFFGQQHTVETKENHFVSLPTESELEIVAAEGTETRLSETYLPPLQGHRSPESTMTMTLSVLSCAPRVFEVENFLSDVEVDYIMKVGQEVITDNAKTENFDGTDVESKINREHSPIIDTVYRRAADLLRIDEALLRNRHEHEYPDLGSKRSIAEGLDIVHHNVGDGDMKASHEFDFPDTMDEYQPTRFVTLAIYLNEDMEGGETSFPTWINAESSDDLRITPKKGKVVFFYSLLPDGNMDGLAQHASLPVTEGEKWVIYLRVWDPIFER